jgi:hypothetical protein
VENGCQTKVTKSRKEKGRRKEGKKEIMTHTKTKQAKKQRDRKEGKTRKRQ